MQIINLYITRKRRKICLLLILLASGLKAAAQTNLGSIAPADSNAVLELSSPNKGLLLSRVQLVATSNPAPLGAFVAGMQLYNTATSNDVLPGVYYCDGTKWVRILSPGNAWTRNGNAGTNPSANYLGTSDSADLSIRTNATERLRVTGLGNVGIGTSNPQARLEVNGKVIINGLPAGSLTDSLITVNPANGVLQSIAASRIVGVKKVIYTASSGQQSFMTPYNITDINKISIYRNGILINCSASGPDTITAEVPCDAGDDIKIIQQL